MAQNFYDILGVSKSADKSEIKKAFREKAKKHHPDKGGSETEFKKINEAYETLSDEKKKAHYDQFGSTQGFGNTSRGSGGFDFSGFNNADFGGQFGGGFEDVFSSFFGGGRSSKKQSPHQKGSDLELELEISFEESINGISRSFPVKTYHYCEECSGKGGQGHKNCVACKGSGHQTQQFQTPFGTVQQQTICAECQGEGRSFETSCKNCKGEGRVKKSHDLKIDVPPGVDEGMTLRFRGKGDAGMRGGPQGDLYAHIKVIPSKTFEREDLDIITTLEISIFQAIEGTTQSVQTFWGEEKLTIPPGTQNQTTLYIRNKGVKMSGKVGDHRVIVLTLMPKKISKKASELLSDLEKETF